MANPRGTFQVDFLRSVVENGGRIANARFSLQRGPLKFVEPVYSLTLEQNGVRSLQELPWTPELERYLLFDAPRRVDDPHEEAERFAAILMNNLETAAERCGKDFSHAVLVQLLKERPEYELGHVLARVEKLTAKPSPSSVQYVDSLTFLRHSIDGLRNTAIAGLRHTPDEANQVMTEALTILLDETFHLSGSDHLFPKHGT